MRKGAHLNFALGEFGLDMPLHWKLKTIVLFVQLACPTKYVCGNGIQISGSSHPKLLRLRFRNPAPQPWLYHILNRLSSKKKIH